MRTVNDVLLRRCRASLLLGVTSLALVACGGDDPAQTNQLGFEGGAAPADEGLSALGSLALYVLAPLAILLVIAALVLLPGMAKGSRYRPARGWGAAPLWFGGPPDPAAAVEAADPAGMVRGGASGSW